MKPQIGEGALLGMRTLNGSDRVYQNLSQLNVIKGKPLKFDLSLHFFPNKSESEQINETDINVHLLLKTEEING